MTLSLHQHPIDALHHNHLEFMQTLPFRWRAWLKESAPVGGNSSTETDPNRMPFAHQMEQRTAERLQALGLTIAVTGNNDPFDLRVSRGDDRLIRIEVKGSQAYYNPTNRTWRYQANTRNQQCDLLLFGCVADFDQIHWFVIPKQALGRRRNLTITSRDPRDYGGQWAAYLEAWGQVKLTLSHSDRRANQPSLI